MYVAVEDVAAAATRVAAAGGTVLQGPADAPPDGRRAIVADPAGVAFGLWQPGALRGVERRGEPGTWAMSALHTPDAPGAEAFYDTAFGWRRQPAPEGAFDLWRLGDQTVAALAPIPGDAPVPPHWAVNVRVADVDATARMAASFGGRVVVAPFDTPGFRNAVLADPQGGVVAVSSF
jgi:predicted enzyme related to lactoylglutathione lyase